MFWHEGHSYQGIHEASQGKDKNCVQVDEQISLGWKDGEEEAGKCEAGQVWDDHWCCAENPTEHHSGILEA